RHGFHERERFDAPAHRRNRLAFDGARTPRERQMRAVDARLAPETCAPEPGPQRQLERRQRRRNGSRPEPPHARRRKEAEHVELELDRPDLDRRDAGRALERFIVDVAEERDRDVQIALRGRPAAGEPHRAAARALDRVPRRIVGPEREENALAARTLVGSIRLRAHRVGIVESPDGGAAIAISSRNANATLCRRTLSLSPSKRRRSARVPSGPAHANHTVPTGLSGVPPPGPAIPLTATARSAPESRLACSASATTTCSLT